MPTEGQAQPKIYDITIEVRIAKSYQVESISLADAQTIALELAIKEYPGMDVWLL